MKSDNFNPTYIRTFSIIAHIDHGKSTLADRILEIGHVTDDRSKRDQVLDSMDLERERGITIKSNSASFIYHNPEDKKEYLFNLIDTPGHVDFSYEVSRSLAACEGVLLLIDATQGIQAQTIANFNLALEADIYIYPVINKVDLPSANVEKIKHQIKNTLGLDPELALCVSGKTGLGVEDLMQVIVKYIPAPPSNRAHLQLRALVFDAYFDIFRGVIEKVRIYDGELRKGDDIFFIRKQKKHVANEIGINTLKLESQQTLVAGQVGYIVTGIKNVADAMLGDTVTLYSNPATEALFTYKEMKPMVFSGLYPVDGDDYNVLKDAIEKLALNDAGLSYEPESSEALGFGFRVGYLGLLHLEIVQERLEREFNLSLLTTAPSVIYNIHLHNGEEMKIDNPSEMPDSGSIKCIEEPYAKVHIIVPQEYLGGVLQLLKDKRGENVQMLFLDEETVQLIYLLPLAEMIFEFYDKLKSFSKGYASLDYEIDQYRVSDLVKLDILVHSNRVDALSMVVFRDFADNRGRDIIGKLRDLIKKHQFQISLQAAIGGRILARENISAMRKNVTAKCYGGDITRKKKLLEKQKSGKKRMKMIGNVEIPQEAFLSLLKTGDTSS